MIVRSSPAGSADGAKTFGEGTCALTRRGGGIPHMPPSIIGGKGPLEVVGKLTYLSPIFGCESVLQCTQGPGAGDDREDLTTLKFC